MFQGLTLLVAVAAVALQAVMTTAKDETSNPVPPSNAKLLSEEEQTQHPKGKVHTGLHRAAFVPPPSFDSAVKWPKCDSIKTIRNQGQCGSCWAVASASVISDRLCIDSAARENVFISAAQVAGCSIPDYNGCIGSDSPHAYKAAVLHGVVTGGDFQSNVGCAPYPHDPKTLRPKNGTLYLLCPQSCTNPKYKSDMSADYAKYQIDSYLLFKTKDVTSQKDIDATVLAMQEEISKNGPITGHVYVHDELENWKPETGPYRGPSPTAKASGNHIIRITGWGVEKGIKYWIVANSWGPNSGKNGYNYIEMGKNVAEIENGFTAPIIDIGKTVKCKTADFCSAPIDEAIRMDYSDVTSPIFLFQGRCILEVKKVGDKLVARGQSVPIEKRLFNAPEAPIVASLHFDGKLALASEAGEMGMQCEKVDGSPKFACESVVNRQMKPSAYTVTSEGIKYQLSDPAGTLLTGSVTKSSSSGYPVGDAFTSVGMTPVAFLDIDGTKTFVFGTDESGKPSGAIMNYPKGAAKPTFSVQPGSVSNILKC